MKKSTRMPLTQVEAEKLTKGLIFQRLSSVHSGAKAGMTAQLYTFDGVPFAEGVKHIAVGTAKILEVLPFACDTDFMIIGNLRVKENSETASLESRAMGYDSYKALLEHLRSTPMGVPFIGKVVIFDMLTLTLCNP